MMRVPFEKMYAEFRRVLLKVGFSPARADVCAAIFAENSRDGVYSHGLNRFYPFIKLVIDKKIDVHAEPEKITSFGALEQWDGHYGPGMINASVCMNRAVEIAQKQGVGTVALRNNSHWMRGGTYGLLAADAGCIGICSTNCIPLIPPWGSAERKLGNNPIVIAVPHKNGPLLIDTSLAQFSNGKLQLYSRAGKPLPVDGGYDREGNLTRDPDKIKESHRPLPIGYWKGAGLAFLIDVVLMCLSGGKASADLEKETSVDFGVSQVFIAIDPSRFWGKNEMDQRIDEIISHYLSAKPISDDDSVHYPGQGMLKIRKENLEQGIPVDEKFWEKIRNL